MADGLRITLVGYGQTALLHTEILAGDGHHLEWLVGRMPDRTEAFARKYGYARHTTNLAQALADPAVDAVVLCTPSPQHAEQTAACLRAGKHVLVEIPLAMSYRRTRELAVLAHATGRTVMVAHTHRFHRALQQVREDVLAGRLTPHSIIARYTLLRRQNVGSSGYIRSWTDNLLWHHGQHSTDMVLWLLGIDEPGQVETTAMLALPDQATGIPLDLSLVLRTARDQLATVAMSYNSMINTYDFLIMAKERTLAVEDGIMRDRDGVVLDPGIDDVRTRQDREFVAAVREGRPASVSPDSVLPTAEVLQQVQDASDAWKPTGATRPTT